jgi:hypothetical protein
VKWLLSLLGVPVRGWRFVGGALAEQEDARFLAELYGRPDRLEVRDAG